MEQIAIYIGIILVLAQFVVLIRMIRDKSRQQKRAGWVLQLLAPVVNIGLAVYYNGLKGTGEAPGLTYFIETFSCLFLASVGVVFFLSAVVVWGVRRGRK